MKTIIEWFGMLPEPMKSQAFENAMSVSYIEKRKDIFTFEVSSLSRAIDTSMAWCDTPQGEDYWRIIHDACDNTENIFKAPLNYSSSMRDMLKSMRNESIVAQRLLRSEDTHTQFANYITMRGEMCSYLPNGREHVVNENGKWARTGRQDMKAVKMARNLLNEVIANEISATDYEKFSNLIKSYISVLGDEEGEGKKINFKVIEGDAIVDAYFVENYSDILGRDTNLFGSCMRHEECGEWLSIYTMNEDKVSMLVAYDINGKVLGRAILWLLDGGKKAMDTIYTHESLTGSFIQWANDNDYYYKSRQSCHHEDFDRHLSGGYISSPKVTLSRYKFSYYPYMDTLSILSGDVLSNNKNESEYKILKNTDGSYDHHDNNVFDVFNGCDIDEDDARYVDYCRPNGTCIEGYVNNDDLCVNNEDEMVLEIDCVMVDGINYLKNSDQIVYVESIDDYCLSDDCVCDINGDYIRFDDAVELHDSEWAHENDAERCMVDGKFYLTCDVTLLDSGYVANVNVDEYTNLLKNLNEKNDAKYNETAIA